MALRLSPFTPSRSAADAAQDVQAKKLLVLDVRESSEFKAGRIPGARHVPLGKLDAGKLKPDRRYLAVCRSGARSSRATRQLRRAGLDVVNLKGGMLAWERAGLPLEPRDGRVR